MNQVESSVFFQAAAYLLKIQTDEREVHSAKENELWDAMAKELGHKDHGLVKRLFKHLGIVKETRPITISTNLENTKKARVREFRFNLSNFGNI